jgi:hypothetical protein
VVEVEVEVLWVLLELPQVLALLVDNQKLLNQVL